MKNMTYHFNKVIKSLFLIMALMLSTTSNGQETTDNGKYSYLLPNRYSFTKINVASNIHAKVRLVTYNAHRLELTCDKEGEKQLDVHVKNFELFVRFKDPNANYHTEVEIELPVLNQITATNGAEIDFVDEIKFKNLNLFLESKAKTNMNVSAENITLSVNDASFVGEIDATKSTIRLSNGATAELNGHCTDVDAYADTKSVLKCQNLNSKIVFVKATNGSVMDVQANTSANIYALTDAVVNLHYKTKPNIISNIKQNGKLNEIKIP